MASKERFQSPVIGDTVNLRMFVMNANRQLDLEKIEKVDIWKLNDVESTTLNPDGRRFIQTIPGDQVIHDATGEYHVELDLTTPLFTVGNYVDIWDVSFRDCEASTDFENHFSVKEDLFFTDVAPVVHDFEFRFQPNRIVKGSKKYITIEVVPCVPRGTDLERYYRNLICVSEILVSMAIKCSDCLPAEQDLRIVVENQPAQFRDGAFAYYKIDTTELDCGLYDMQFTLNMGENCFVSEKQQLLIFD